MGGTDQLSCRSCHYSVYCEECGGNLMYCTLKNRMEITACDMFNYEPGTDEIENTSKTHTMGAGED